MKWALLYANVSWLILCGLSIWHDKRAQRWLNELRQRQERGVLVEVGTTVVLNGEPLHVYKIEGTKLFTTTTIFTERVQ